MAESGKELPAYILPTQLRAGLAELAKPLQQTPDFSFRQADLVKRLTNQRPSSTTVTEDGIATTQDKGAIQDTLSAEEVLVFIFSSLGVAQSKNTGLADLIQQEIAKFRALAETKHGTELRAFVGEVAVHSIWNLAFNEFDDEIRSHTNKHNGVLAASRQYGDFIVNQAVAQIGDVMDPPA